MLAETLRKWAAEEVEGTTSKLPQPEPMDINKVRKDEEAEEDSSRPLTQEDKLKINDFLLNSKDKEDWKMHEFANELGVNIHMVEEYIAGLAADSLRKTSSLPHAYTTETIPRGKTKKEKEKEDEEIYNYNSPIKEFKTNQGLQGKHHSEEDMNKLFEKVKASMGKNSALELVTLLETLYNERNLYKQAFINLSSIIDPS